jgi:radical SAM superfamily enzyme YgiQ (UPF0313 family)
VLLVSTYDLGRQSFGLASPAAWLRNAGIDVDCVDVSRDALDDGRIAAASFVGFYLPMHTATRLAGPLIERVQSVNPDARVCAYGLYAPLNSQWLLDRGVDYVLGPEAEQELVELVKSQSPNPKVQRPVLRARSLEPSALPRLRFIQPDRSRLPALSRYASLQMPDGTKRVVGSTEATRGCKHLCRHCPIVPVYRGQFRVIPVDVVIDDIGAQVEAGAAHISFADPDFLNGPAHARRVVERLHRGWPGLTYDITTKIAHLLEHASLVPVLRETGCLFVTSAVESVDDRVLEKLLKGHSRDDFIKVALMCRAEGLTLAPTFVPFTPWTTEETYNELLDTIADLDLVEQVAPVQLGIRLLVTSESPLLDLADVRQLIGAFDAESLVYPWCHPDPRVDVLQASVMRVVQGLSGRSRADVFAAISEVARTAAGLAPRTRESTIGVSAPYMSEPWYCCAEPLDVGV